MGSGPIRPLPEMPFVKLDCGILDSSLWVEAAPVRIVFITVLAMSGPEGVCRATAPGIARRANLPIAQVRSALELLEAPDEESRSLTDEGRRLKRVDGGYFVVNYARYRAKDYTATERKRRERDRKRDASRVTSRPVTQVEGEVEGEVEKKQRTRPAPSASSAPADVVAVFDHWKTTMGHPKAKLDSRRKSLIGSRLRDYTAADLCAAIDGCRLSDFHMGANQDQKVYDGLRVILRDAEQIEKFMVTGAKTGPGAQNHETPEEAGRRRTERALAAVGA